MPAKAGIPLSGGGGDRARGLQQVAQLLELDEGLVPGRVCRDRDVIKPRRQRVDDRADGGDAVAGASGTDGVPCLCLQLLLQSGRCHRPALTEAPHRRGDHRGERIVFDRAFEGVGMLCRGVAGAGTEYRYFRQ